MHYLIYDIKEKLVHILKFSKYETFRVNTTEYEIKSFYGLYLFYYGLDCFVFYRIFILSLHKNLTFLVSDVFFCFISF